MNTNLMPNIEMKGKKTFKVIQKLHHSLREDDIKFLRQ